MSKTPQTTGLTRRDVLQTGSAATLLGLTACGGGRDSTTTPTDGGDPGITPNHGDLFLNNVEMNTLRALVDTLIPEDIDPGAAASGCAEAINLLLSAFSFNPPMIFAGGPFSDRGGATSNDFKNFLPLDAYEERAWRLKIEGSQSRAELEFNGPRQGWQAIYREGLAALDEAAAGYGFGSFADMPAPTRELLIQSNSDARINELMDIAFLQTLDAMYGAPEYGGNRELNGWNFTAYDGDVQPRGYTDEEVTTPDNPGLADLLPLRRKRDALPSAALLPIPDARQLEMIQAAFKDLMAMSSPELALGAMLGSESRLSRLQAAVDQHRPSRRGEKA